jgi:hypothetical protein
VNWPSRISKPRPRDLLIYDRGDPAFWLMTMHRVRGIDFCMRLTRGTFRAAKAFWHSREATTVITLKPSGEQARACRNQGLPAEALRVRLVRVRLPKGEAEVLRSVYPHACSRRSI